MYLTYINDERHSSRKNLPRPSGLWQKSGHTSLSSSTVVPPQPSDSASSGLISARNAAGSRVHSRL